MSKTRIARFSNGLGLLENTIASLALVAMATLVFFEVLIRLSSRWPLSTTSLCFLIFGLMLPLTFAMQSKTGVLKRLVRAAVFTLALVAALYFLLSTFAQGIPDARTLALGLMVWAALIGASIAIREEAHIHFGVSEIIESMVSPELKKVAPLVSAGFCGVFTVLASIKLAGEIAQWQQFSGAGLFASLPIPTWTITLALPFAFFLMTIRYLIRWLK